MQQHVRARARKMLALATTLGITAGLTATVTGAVAAAPAVGTAADEVVVPDPGREKPRLDVLLQAGATGYAHRQEGTEGIVWTDAASGATKPLPWQAESGHSGLSAKWSGGAIEITDLATDRKTSVDVPQGLSWIEAFTADTVLAGRFEADKLTSITLLSSVDGAPSERPVTGLPASVEDLYLEVQDSGGALFSNPVGDRAFYLDFASAVLTELPPALSGLTDYRLSPAHILARKGGSGTLLSVPRSNPTVQPVTTVVVAKEAGLVTGDFGVLGDWVLTTAYAGPRPALGAPLRAVPLGGDTAVELLPHTAALIVPAGDGSLRTVGGSSATDWAVRRIALGTDTKPVLDTVRAVPVMPRGVTRLALGGGRLSYLSPRDDTTELLDVDVNTTGAPASATPTLRYSFRDPATSMASLGDGDTVAYSGSTLAAPTGLGSYKTFPLPPQSTVVDAAGRYAVATDGTRTYVGDLEHARADASAVLLTLTDSPAAVWGTKAWKPAATAGTVNSYDLKTKATSAPVDLGSGCRPTELQATGRWLYWACGTTKAGVYDQTLKKSVAVPTGEALLGDGFVVRHEGDRLRLTDAATGTTTDFADLTASATGSGRRTTWTVDKFGGDVAFVDPRTQDIHVKRVASTRQPLALVESHVPSDLPFSGKDTAEPKATWAPVWRFSKPVGSWKVSLLKGNGEVLRTFEGTRGDGAAVRVAWDGKDAKGRGIESGQYRWEMTARPLDGVGAAQTAWAALNVTGSSLTTLPGTYTPVAPTRLMDTRSGLGVPKAKLGADGKVILKVAGTAGVPAEGLSAVVLNVTATNATTSSFVSVYPYETQRTSASNLNFTAGRTSANLVTVPVVNGWVEFYNRAGSVDLLADVAGYYTEGTAGSAYQPVTPTRLMDTRTGTGVAKAKLAANGTVTLPVTEPGATAVVMNVTATNPTATSFVSVYPYGTTRTAASNLNFTAGRTVPNLVVVPVKDGKVTFYNKAGTVDLLADVAGYFKKDTGSVFTGMQPKRLMDTRNGTGVARAKVGAGKTVNLAVGFKYTAVVLNVTATNPTATGFVSVYPYGTTRTAASNLNFTAGQTVPNLVVVPVKEGKVTFYNHAGTVDLIADIAGYYTR
ncbi:hypothetical protein [Streptomyces sp. NBC_01268]|uniref:hypothetical protein n=1 Tax=Streptomyces sp. NBC_01268 TaxID=2903806 RepID=UPI002E314F56|nr:hypothetical protein [Streptomyces sp. NBC_01268]